MLIADLEELPSPCYVLHCGKLEENLRILSDVRQRTGARILLALKGFAMWSVFPQIREHLSGVAASSLDEALLGFEEFDREVHVYAPAYRHEEFPILLGLSDHIVFNSFSQWKRFRGQVAAAPKKVSCGIRVNPEHSEVTVDIYNPCAPHSRLGVTRANFRPDLLDGIEGLHFHTLCEKNADSLVRTLTAVEQKFGEFIPKMRWVNFGGGHHITRPDYDVELLVETILGFRRRYPGTDVILEPGEAVALHTGVLVATVLDIIDNGMPIAILDTSAAAHMPDVLEMPYRPEIEGAGRAGEFAHTYRLGGLTCLAGDVIGDYSFPAPLAVGQRLIFGDMAHYSMVKNTTFNGVRLPAIAIYNPGRGKTEVIRRFTHEDYKERLS